MKKNIKMNNNIPIELINFQNKNNKPDKNGFKINDIVKIDMSRIESKISDNDLKDEMYGIISHTNKYEDDDKNIEIQYGLKVLNKNKKLESSYWVSKKCITLVKR